MRVRVQPIPKLCSLSPPPTEKPCSVQPSCHPVLSLVEAGLKSCVQHVVSGAVANNGRGRAKGWSDRNIHSRLSVGQYVSLVLRVNLFLPGNVLHWLPESLQKSENSP